MKRHTPVQAADKSHELLPERASLLGCRCELLYEVELFQGKSLFLKLSN